MKNTLHPDSPKKPFQELLIELQTLQNEIVTRTKSRMASIPYIWPDTDKEYSAKNLSTYLSFRQKDIRPLQDRLSEAGLSSLGRGESNIMENIEHVINILTLMSCEKIDTSTLEKGTQEISGKNILIKRSNQLFGDSPEECYTKIMTTLSTEASSQYELILNLIHAGTNCVRINCAHDNAEDWSKMVSFVKKAKKETGKECKIFMDLAGMKIRTGPIGTSRNDYAKIRLREGDHFTIRTDAKMSVPISVNPITGEILPAILSCSNDAFMQSIKVGDSVWIDDGLIGAVIESIFDKGIHLRVTHAGPKGARIKEQKGLNFPDTALKLPVLTPKDYQDLEFVVENADIIGLSFVQSAADLDLLIQELKKRNKLMPIVAKIETRLAVENLPEILFRGLGYEGEFAIMIARGDLAVELGSVRIAEIQEEILWLCEAAHIPVIWATQVLETLAKKGIVSRPEITDAAMSVRAECVMLNKGEYITNAVEILRDILNRMQAHQYKKISRLRALHW